MGDVWKARDTRLSRLVAIKRLTAPDAQRFEREARAIAALNHPHICQIYDVGTDFLVMEFVDGRPLSGPLAPAEALGLATQIASALEEAHGRGVLHRDLKPANILVTATGSAKLLDFGIAKLLGDSDVDATSTGEGTVIGTPAYMSPEQVRGERLDQRSDVFSFGAVLYELLAGRRAFSGPSGAVAMSAILTDSPPPLAVPDPIARLVAQCLHKSASDRPPTMQAVRAALERIAAPTPDAPASIAVLPFTNMSRDPDDEYFSDGLAEEIINSLVHVPGLKVIARTSAFAFKGKNEDVRRIADALGANKILEGSVRRAGNRLRVTAQLIHAADGTHLWSERYDREMADVFAVQDEIAGAIAAALRLQLSPPRAESPRRQPTLPAYEAFLKARFHRQRVTSISLAKCREYVEQAIALDPEFAQAHSEMGLYYVTSAIFGAIAPDEGIRLGRLSLQRALNLDPVLAEAHAALGIAAVLGEYDWDEARRQFSLALASTPVSPQIRQWHAYFYLRLIGRFREAIDELETGLADDPRNAISRFALAQCLECTGERLEAERQFCLALEIDDRYWPAWFFYALNLFLRNRVDEAKNAAERAHDLNPESLVPVALQAGLAFRSGDAERYQALQVRIAEGHDPVSFGLVALLHEDLPSAAEHFEAALRERTGLVGSFVLRHPIANPLRASAYWPRLARLMNLPTPSFPDPRDRRRK
jgi:serine/threonine-protein kinase